MQSLYRRITIKFEGFISVGKGWQKLVFATGFNRFKPAGRNPLWQKLAKTGKTSHDDFVDFLDSNGLERTKACRLLMEGTLRFAKLPSFLIGDSSKCLDGSYYL